MGFENETGPNTSLFILWRRPYLTSKPKYNRRKLSSCSFDVVDKWKDVAEACAKEMDMNIDFDKYEILLLSFVGTA